MIDMEQEIELVWNYSNRKWFVGKGYNFTAWGDKFIVKAKDLNPGSGIKIEYTCDVCGAKIITPLYVYNQKKASKYGDTCKKCCRLRSLEQTELERKNKMYNRIVKMAKDKGYELLFDIKDYKNQTTQINYICPKHGLKHASAAHFVLGGGCKKCAIEKTGDINRLPIEEVIERIESVNNNKLLNPEDYETNNKRNLKIRCGCGNIFYGCVNEIHKRYRCSKCAKSESAGENKIKNFLKSHNISFTPQYKYDDCRDKRPLPFDFHLDDYSINIEFDGKQHSYPVFGEDSFKYTQRHDLIKNNYCEKNNIKLIRINYDQYKDIDEILSKELLNT